ncbi:amino acid ABC transporter ATP-binding protein [Amnibacterium flavum]|uniref:ABC-type polar-amino-acid transporter n=1 Tax=Amnibacterium flavum TaxID=2173173 RepID=A0A2V1HWE5_9MICO|nr:amino acid ABC transporter ATP-binding protein [Amnibacterium flavum]PVZ94514.1 peptide ABC transporter ATP-binding protein [Amnibacterium flavum]
MPEVTVPLGRKSGLPAGEHYEIELRDLHKSYGDNEVLKGIDLDIALGEVVVILGPSGSGKSTMLRCINMLETPTSGEIRVRGQVVDSRPANLMALRREVGMVFQQFNLFPNMTVLENVAAGPRYVRGMSRADSEARAQQLLTRVGIVGKDDVRPTRLSGGQQQRVAIARALALEPRVVLFDEPTSALDPELRGEVLDTMKSLASQGTTMAVVTHEMSFARHVASRVIFIDGGVIVEEGDPAQVLERPKSARLRQFLNKLEWEND